MTYFYIKLTLNVHFTVYLAFMTMSSFYSFIS